MQRRHLLQSAAALAAPSFATLGIARESAAEVGCHPLSGEQCH